MMGTDLELRPEDRAVHGLELAERVFTPERRLAITRFLNIEPDDPALIPYLAACASYGLDPVMGQIWLIPQRVKVRDGDADRWVERYRPSVGRDGYLAIAHRDPRFKGLKGAVVCERDVFEVSYDGSPDEPTVLHKFASKPTVFEDGMNPARWRGRILGAWAKLSVHDADATFFFAPINEHVRMRPKYEGKGQSRHMVLDGNGNPVLEPDGAWGYVSTMIQKAAQSYVLRIGLGITGMVPADEMVDSSRADAQATAVELPDLHLEGFDLSTVTTEVALQDRLRAALNRIEELAPGSWPPAKCEMVMTGMSEPELSLLAARIEGEADLLAERALRAAERTAAAPAQDQAPEPAEPGEAITDAQVVPEDDPAVQPQEPAKVEAADALRRRLEELADDMNDPALSDEDLRALDAEYKVVEKQLAALEDPGQGQLL